MNPNTGADLPSYTGENEKGEWLIDPKSVRVAHNTVWMDATRASVLVLPVPLTKPAVNDVAHKNSCLAPARQCDCLAARRMAWHWIDAHAPYHAHAHGHTH